MRSTITRTRRDATCLLAGLALLVTGVVVAECGPGVTAGSADVQLVRAIPHRVSFEAR
ncbi:hypothetical protein JL107_07085 [Nakamurella flavida]|uniref:Uncharacterized protein n=1 Tax=Nakamurella flavida TaxID=363630 RepID=A0A939C261_9ACTN|nr:hypothetical protein [Nakamurella flavida]MBM9476205.1 hypothetical protein [Nakamurella flavida]MDP9779697.1 hypothetical protein [Nakamurella flavida]